MKGECRCSHSWEAHEQIACAICNCDKYVAVGLPSRPRPEGDKARYAVPEAMLSQLTKEQGYNFAEAMHNRAVALKEQGYISSFWEGILNDVNLVQHYVIEVYWLKPPPPEMADMERFREAPRQLPSPSLPDVQC